MISVADIIEMLDSGRPRHPLESEGWSYVDHPAKFSPEMWRAYLDFFGVSEYIILAESSGVNSAGRPWQRGQLLVSPQGMRNLAAKLKALEEKDAAQVH